MADDDTTTAPAPAPGGLDLNNPIIQQLLQGGGAIQGPPAPTTPAVNRNLPFTGMLGEALGGGVSPLYPMSEAQQTQAGNAALLNFGINMLQNSSGPVRHSLGQAIASGLLGAQGSLAGVREGQGQMLDIQNKQQTMQLERLKTLLPLLRMQQAAGMPNPLLGGGGGGGGTLAATGDPIAALPKADALPAIVQRESGGQNINTRILGPDGKPASTASGYYQMVDGTWQEGARLAGLKNPPARAIDASKADQDAAASALFDKHGYAPWKPIAPTTTATSPPATTTASAAPTAPPGVQMGGAPPPPPGGSAGPYAGSGIGAALAPPKPDIATSPTLRRGGPATPPAPGQVSANVGAMQAGRDLAQTAPPVTALTAGPGAPTAVATAAPAAPQPGWGSVVGTYGLPGQTPPATPPTVTPPAQPTPQQPTQGDQPPAPTGPLTIEQYRALHPIAIDPRTFTVTPPNLDNLQRALNEATQRRDLALKGYGGNVDKAGSDYREASKAIVDAQQAAQTKSLELQQAAQKDAEDRRDKAYGDELTRQQQAKLEADKLAQTASEADKQRAAALQLEQVKAGQTWHQQLEQQSAEYANTNTLKPMTEQALKAHQMNLSLAQLQPLLKDLPPGGGALGAVLESNPDLGWLTNAAGITDPKQTDAVRLVNGLVSNISTQMKPTGLGALREYEWNAFKSQLPSMLSTPGGQQKAVAILMNMNNRIQDEGAWMNNYFNRKVPDELGTTPGATRSAHNLEPTEGALSVQQLMDKQLGPIIPQYTGPPSAAGQAQWEQTLPPGKPFFRIGAVRDPKNPNQPLRDNAGQVVTTKTYEVRPWQ